jgi:DNA polymerase-3 subunit beta
MKFTTPAGDFLECLKSVHSRTKGQTIEILKHIRLDVEGQQLTLTGHDMSASCEAYLGVDSPANGSCAVPAQAIVQLIGSLPKSAHIVVETDDTLQQIAIKSGKSRYKLPFLKSNDFPAALTCEGGVAVQLSADDVQTLFGRARQALDPRDARPFGQGLYLHVADGGLCASGISLYHFARTRIETKSSGLSGAIVPLSAVDEISRICRDGGHITVSERTIAAEAAGRRFCSKLIEETYPNYTALLPKMGATYVDVDREEMLQAVRRLTSIASDFSVVELSVGENEVALTLSGIGEGAETVHCSCEAKVDGFVAISAQRFIEMLEMPKGEVIQFHFTKGSMLVRIHDPSDPTFILCESTRIPKNYRAAA